MITLFQPFKSSTEENSLANGLECLDASRTKQSFTEDADINTIVERFGLTGQLPDDYKAPQYGDFSDVVDFHTAMDAIRGAAASFMELPGKLRERFGNDPQNLIAFLGDKTNLQDAVSLGLVQPPPDTPPAPPAPSKSALSDTSSST